MVIAHRTEADSVRTLSGTLSDHRHGRLWLHHVPGVEDVLQNGHTRRSNTLTRSTTRTTSASRTRSFSRRCWMASRICKRTLARARPHRF